MPCVFQRRASAGNEYEIAGLMLDAGADPTVGDYAAFRETQTMPARGRASAELQSFAARVAPTGASGDKINLESRLAEVELELNDVALKSLRAPPGSSDRIEYDRRYDELQDERAKLRRSPGISGGHSRAANHAPRGQP